MTPAWRTSRRPGGVCVLLAVRGRMEDQAGGMGYDMDRSGNVQLRPPYECLPAIRVAGDIVKRAGTGLGPRQIEDYELLCFPDGTKSVYRVGEMAYTLDEPCFIVTRPGETHQYEYDPAQPSRHLFIHFGYPHRNGEAPPLAILRPGGPSVIPAKDELLIGMMKQIMNIAYLYPDKLQQRGSSLLAALLEEINGLVVDQPVTRDRNRVPPQILKALDYIDKHLDEPLSIDRLARRVGWTHEHFSRQHARYYDISPREAIMKERIELACQMLIQENWSIQQVAYWVGFDDEHYFSRCFRKIKGMSASSFREKYANPHYRHLAQVKEASSYPLNRYYRFDRW